MPDIRYMPLYLFKWLALAQNWVIDQLDGFDRRIGLL